MLLLAAAALTWIAPQDARLSIHGLPWLAENKGELIRLPRRLEPELPKAVWNLGLSPSGARIRFRTNSSKLAIKLTYPSAPNMINMHAYGQTGVDLYIDGAYKGTAIAPKDAAPVEHTYFAGLPKQHREITLYLPLYKPVTVHAIGLDDDAAIEKPRRFANPKPVVYYGTSITQGGCASRSGLSYQAILSRRLNLDFVNLGFSGNGRGEPVAARMTAEIDASLFVLDFSQNNPNLDSLQAAYEPFLDTVRKQHPQVPIIAVTPIAHSSPNIRFTDFAAHIRSVVNRRIAAGDRLLSLVEGHSLLGPHQLDGLVDGVHPNDLGFQFMADGLAPHVANALHLPPPSLVNDFEIRLNPAIRSRIVDFIWGTPGFPKSLPAAVEPNAPPPIASLKHAASVERFTIRMEAGQENTTHHLIPRRPNRQLIVLHHGHSCSFDDGAGLAEAADAFLAAGYAVLTAYMPHMRPGDCQTLSHAALFDLPLPAGNALKFFLEPTAISLNRLKPRYKQIHMAGLSGGGWTTTLYAAVDPAIRLSFPVAGTMPLYLRANGSIGDKEQWLDPFYRLAGYPDLYVLGASGPGRRQVQILNRRDNCCFGEPQHGPTYEPSIRAYEARVREALGDPARFRVVIDDDAPKHMVSPTAVQLILKELAR
jgi:hypothetical protein